MLVLGEKDTLPNTAAAGAGRSARRGVRARVRKQRGKGVRVCARVEVRACSGGDPASATGLMGFFGCYELLFLRHIQR